MGDEAARNYLARFLFRGDEVLRTVSSLSGGERSRLALACLLVEGSNLLILDEPTNHLDIQSRETLEEMLVAYDGTVVFVSHDRFFIDRVSTRVWEIAGSGLTQYLGNCSDMMRQKARASRADSSGKQEESAVVTTIREEQAQLPRKTQASEQRLQKQLVAIEQAIGRLEGQLNELSDAIAIASVDGDLGRLESLGHVYASTQVELDEAYARWEEINSQIDSLSLVGLAR
jgi:ATP-binding cassette subfamily F protein 3